MPIETAREITEYLKERVDDGLRTVVIVQPNGQEIHYLRDDLKKEYTEETFSDVVDAFRLETPYLSPGIESRPVGERRGIVHYHEHAFVIQFPVSNSESILISLSPEAGRDLMDFLEICRQKVVENYVDTN